MLFHSFDERSNHFGGPVKSSAVFLTDVWTVNPKKKEVTTPEVIMYIPGISVKLLACMMFI